MWLEYIYIVKYYIYIYIYRVGHEKLARLPFCTCTCYSFNFCIYAMLRTRATFSWPTLYIFTVEMVNVGFDSSSFILFSQKTLHLYQHMTVMPL